jgi:hypothetical protein
VSNRKHKPAPVRAKPASAHSWKPKTLAGWLWSALVVVIGLAGGVAGIWAVVKPVVHVDPYIQLDPLTPFSERFKVSNDGYLSIYNIDASCYIGEAKTSAIVGLHGATMLKNILITSRRRQILEPGNSMTINCPVDQIMVLNSKFVSAEIEFIIDFNPSWYFWREHMKVRFSGQLDSQGNVQWTYE